MSLDTAARQGNRAQLLRLVGLMSAPILPSAAALRRRVGVSAMVLVTLVYASLMLISFGGSALAASGHRFSELLHLRDDVPEQTNLMQQRGCHFNGTPQEADTPAVSLPVPVGGCQKLNMASPAPTPQMTFADWIDLVALEPVGAEDCLAEWPVIPVVPEQRQRHHRSVVLHL